MVKLCAVCNKEILHKTRSIVCSTECLSKRLKYHQKVYQDKNKEKNSIRAKLYNLSNKEEVKSRHYKTRYGITLDEAKIILQKQGNTCAICNKILDLSTSKDKLNTAVVDHCHNKKTVRGILCGSCNLLLGYAKDNISILKNAICYLEKQN